MPLRRSQSAKLSRSGRDIFGPDAFLQLAIEIAMALAPGGNRLALMSPFIIGGNFVGEV